MTLWQAGDIVVNGLMLHYTRTGGAKPPVVLAHGFSDDGLCWTPVAEALAADYDVVMADARGHGRSAAPEQGYGSADHATDLAGVIRALGLKRPGSAGPFDGRGIDPCARRLIPRPAAGDPAGRPAHVVGAGRGARGASRGWRPFVRGLSNSNVKPARN